ncbi:unnamed protein product [Dibothriocephalus latus]|uniref:Uncharacterized protein n=1 Tax=Dibothriocephalus latus TaxID=60516 RepID=A0A3P7N2C2_DIBLA|nr:unnamed protein product [Dibothriocephalus latus]
MELRYHPRQGYTASAERYRNDGPVEPKVGNASNRPEDVEAISPAPEEARIMDAQDAKLQREHEEVTRQLATIDLEINKQESQLRYLCERESSLADGLNTETPRTKFPPAGTDEADERTYENPTQVTAAAADHNAIVLIMLFLASFSSVVTLPHIFVVLSLCANSGWSL